MSSQLSLDSHASSRSIRSADHSSLCDSRAELTRVSRGRLALRGASGHGYLTSTRMVARSKSTGGVLSHARQRRKQERNVDVHEAVENENIIGVANDDLGSYLMSFGRNKAGEEVDASKQRSLPSRGGEVDWNNLLESGNSFNGMQSDDDSVFKNSKELDDHEGSAFLKKPTQRSAADLTSSRLPLSEQTRDRFRKISTLSSKLKFPNKNSGSPSVSDFVLTDSIDDSPSTSHAPVATQNRLRRMHTRNLLSDSDHSLERNDVKDVTKFISTIDIDTDSAHFADRFKPVTIASGVDDTIPRCDDVTISEEQSISELSEFKQNVLTSINQLEADINELHHQSEESIFEHNLHDVHSLRELEDFEDLPSDRDLPAGKSNTSSSDTNGGRSSMRIPTSTERQQAPLRNRQSGFKFSAMSTAIEDIPDKKQKPLSYDSHEFESESVSEVESVIESVASEGVEEESAIPHSREELSETVASGDSDGHVTEERHTHTSEASSDGGREHLELGYSSFSEDEQRDRSGVQVN